MRELIRICIADAWKKREQAPALRRTVPGPQLESGGLPPLSHDGQCCGLLLCAGFDPGVYLGVQDVEGERSVAKDFVVEGAQVEFVSQLLAGGLAQF